MTFVGAGFNEDGNLLVLPAMSPLQDILNIAFSMASRHFDRSPFALTGNADKDEETHLTVSVVHAH